MRVLLFLIFLHVPALADTQLYLFGGGVRPKASLNQFAKTAGYENAKVLIIMWGSEIPEEYYKTLSEDLISSGVKQTMPSYRVPQTQQELNQFIRNLNSSSGVFFSGGDQNKIMDGIESLRLQNKFKELFDKNIPLAGTSAGTAVMSKTMLTGDGSKTRSGLGFLDKVILDQHFIKRSRQDRLIKAIKETGNNFGIGIDEDSSLILKNEKNAQIFGKTDVVFIRLLEDGSVQKAQLQDGMKFNLKSWNPCSQFLKR